jgi:hypothetical protein
MLDRGSNWLTARPARLGSALFALFTLAIPAYLIGGCKGPAEPPPKPVEAPAAVNARPFYVPRLISEEERAGFLGSRECLSCHPKYEDQLRSHHARTLELASARTDGDRFRKVNRVSDPIRSVAYETKVDGDRCVLEAQQSGKRGRVTAHYAFGSGNRGRTYVGEYGRDRVELRLSYYRRAGSNGRWDFTLGQEAGSPIETPVGRMLDYQRGLDCFLCHSTALVGNSAELALDRSIFAIGCETCHGPGKAHLEAVRARQADHLMPRLSEHRQEVATDLCGKCHRFPTGDEADNPIVRTQLPRFQGLAMSMSRCFTQSQGKLTCVTCHDPHRNADTITRVEYNRACLSCHTPHAPQQVACPKQPAGDCVSCHMPVQTVMMPTRPSFHTHWIKVWESKPGTAGKKQPAAKR